MFGLFKKGKKHDSTNLESTANTSKENNVPVWDENLSWTQDDRKKDVYVNGFDPEGDDIGKIDSSNYSGPLMGDRESLNRTPITVLVEKLENYPKLEEIQKRKQDFEANIARLEQAKNALEVITKNQQDISPSLMYALTIVDSDLRQSVVDQQTYESKLKAELEAVESLLSQFENTPEYEKVLILLGFYGFEKNYKEPLSHIFLAKPKLKENTAVTYSAISTKIQTQEKKKRQIKVIDDEENISLDVATALA